jgi:aldehyde dehydrogenase (NAD+)
VPSIAEIFETLEYGPAPENAAPVLEWLARRDHRFDHWIEGRAHPPAAGARFDTANPATGTVIASIAQGDAADIDAAVRAARAALDGWRALGSHGRARWLHAIARELQKHSRFFAVLESLDNGKPIRESRDIDVPLAARHFHHHAGWAQLLDVEFAGCEGVGVVGQIIPWNFPLLMLAWKVAPALAAGNTVVLKPAEFTPLTALRFAELCADIGLPAGVLNIVTGDGTTGAALVEHPGVDKIAFTGSTEVGRTIRRVTAGTGKKLSLELGGKSPFLVFDDADLDSVVEGVVDAIWFNQGQVCCAGSRILAQESIAERLTAKLRERMERLRVGDPLDKTVDVGAIIAPVQLEKIERLVEQGREEGATLWQPAWTRPQDGCFFPPTLFTGVEPASTIAQVEIFGPVVVLMTFRTPAEAVALANNTRYGLAASVWTENVNLALDIAPRLQAGTVWVNSTNLFDAAAGFGGYRESGFGREGGREGMYEYLIPSWQRSPATRPPAAPSAPAPGPALEPPAGARDAVPTAVPEVPAINRTSRLYIAGRHTRPDSGYSHPVTAPDGTLLGEVATGNRKDIRNAVEAARAAAGPWARATAHLRSQIVYFLAENLAIRAGEFAARIAAMTGDEDAAAREVDLAIERLFAAAAYADKFDGTVHATPLRNVTLAMHEPLGTLGIVLPGTAPLLALVSAVGPAIAMGNAVVVVPAERHPLAATDFCQVLDTSDVPAGVVNILTGPRAPLAEVMAGHADLDGLWCFGADTALAATVESLAAEDMKRTWVDIGFHRDWSAPGQGGGREFLRRATQIKNIWVPYGE